MNVKEDLKIDKTNLDKEWERQPELINEYTLALASKQRELDKAKLAFDVASAQVKNTARGFGTIVKDGRSIKITENALAEIITLDEGLIKRQEEISNLEYEVDVLKGAVEALRNKKTALEWESQLYIVGYFGEPKIDKTQIRQRG